MTVMVKTKAELEKAMKNKEKEIIVVGELAEKIHRSKKITKLGPIALAALTAAIAAIPLTGGVSAALGITTAAALTGMEIATIAGGVFVGVYLLIALYKDYDEIEVNMSDKSIKLRKK